MIVTKNDLRIVNDIPYLIVIVGIIITFNNCKSHFELKPEFRNFKNLFFTQALGLEGKICLHKNSIFKPKFSVQTKNLVFKQKFYCSNKNFFFKQKF